MQTNFYSQFKNKLLQSTIRTKEKINKDITHIVKQHRNLNKTSKPKFDLNKHKHNTKVDFGEKKVYKTI